MYPNILSNEQNEILPHLEPFTQDYYLVGGTAIALHLGHRRSIDFDLFTPHDLKTNLISNWIKELPFDSIKLLYKSRDQWHYVIHGVKITFMHFPFDVSHPFNFYGIPMPSVLSLAAMKSFALGRRAKWKDYVDLYFILKNKHSMKEINIEAEKVFSTMYNNLQFRQQLSYFDDIDYTEKVNFMDEPVPDDVIKSFLTNMSYSKF